MNAPIPLQNPLGTPVQMQDEGADIDLLQYWDLLVDSRWMILLITLLALAIGAGYAFLAKPTYEANLLVQVEDSSGSAKSFLGDAASLFDVKTAATAEIEILRSRMVVGLAVDNTRYYIMAEPRYVPVIGNWLARHSSSLSHPGLLGFGGFVHGRERIKVDLFNVPTRLEGTEFILTAKGGGAFTLKHPDLPNELSGHVGAGVQWSTPVGPIAINVSALEAEPGAEFRLFRGSRLGTVEQLQDSLKLVEKGRQSGMINATLQGPNRERLVSILNEIGSQYVRQNIERKAAEAQKTLSFLDVQLPQLKKQLDLAEEAYNRYRNQQGTVSLDEEAKLILARSVELQGQLMEAQQKRRELLSRFTAEHPSVRTLDDQIAAIVSAIATLNSRVRGLPTVQQDALRLERDVKVNNEAYQQLRNNSLQLQLVREGKVGNVRLIDEAVLPQRPVSPRVSIAVSLALVLGLLAGVLVAVARSALNRGIRDPSELEAKIGISVYSTIPLSHSQQLLATKVANKQPGLHLLAEHAPDDAAVEALRSLRTALQFAMLDSPNNRVLITGATPSVGKSFVSANLAAVLATGGKRILLIDADLRKGYLNQYFGLRRADGLSEVIAGSMTMESAIHRAVLPNLDVLTTGTLPPNPAEMMVRGMLGKLLEQVSARYDVVIIDTAPILAAADTMSVAPHAGTIFLVARAGVTQAGEMMESVKRLAQTGRGATGILFNAMDLSRRYYGSYGYKYGGYRYRQYNYVPNTNVR